MEENSKKKKIKEVSIALIVCAITLVCLGGLSAGLYNVFYNGNDSQIPTLSENNVKEQKQEEQEKQEDDEELMLKLTETEEEEEIKEEPKEEENEKKDEEVKEKPLTEEEKKKIEEERKKQEEERKRKEEEERKRQAQAYPYWIKVNYTANTVTVYGKDANGNYTVPVKAMVCSTGRATPRSGVYKTPQKARWGALIGSFGQYCTRITGQILFHSVPYLKNGDKSSLEYWEYDRLGETRSMGCIRLTVIDAKWLFDNCPLGTSVEFYSSSNPGPLGKPSARKISSYPEPLKLWDPTDPDPNNPWRNQDAIEAKKKAEEEAAARKKAEEEEAARKKAEEEAAARRKAEEEAAAKKKAEEEARKKAEEAEKAEKENNNEITVPNVIGLTEAVAKKNLVNLGLNVNTEYVEYKNDSGMVNGIVSKQSIKSNEKAKKGDTIKIFVNKIIKSTNENNIENDKID